MDKMSMIVYHQASVVFSANAVFPIAVAIVLGTRNAVPKMVAQVKTSAIRLLIIWS